VHAKFQRSTARGIFSISGLNGVGRENVRFQRKTGHIRKRCKIRPRLLLITNRKWHTPCQTIWKSLTLDDLEDRYALLWLNGARWPRLLIISYRKCHMLFQIKCKSSTLDDLEGQYCNRNCICCSASSLTTAGLSCRVRSEPVRHGQKNGQDV